MNLKFVQGSRLFSRVLSFSAHDTPNKTQQKQTNPNNNHNGQTNKNNQSEKALKQNKFK